MTPQELKNSILQLAIQGKLVEQRPEEGTGEELYRQIQAEKQKLIREGRIKKEKPLPEIAEDEVPFDIPESWKWCRLGEIGSWASGATPSRAEPEYYGGTIPWLKTGDLNDGHVSWVPESITEKALAKTSIRMNPTGSVLMAMYGATIGKLAILDVPMTTNQACCACVPSAGVYNQYLFYFLLGCRKAFIKMGEGGAQPNISKEKIVSSLFPLPPLIEQKRIVAKIEELLPLIDRYEKAWSRLEEFNRRFPADMQKSLLQMAIQGKLVEQRAEEGTGEELYRQIQAEKQRLIKEGKIKKEKPLPDIAEDEVPFEIPKSWKWVRFSDLTLLMSTGPFGSMLHKADYVTDGIPLVNPANIMGDRIIPSQKMMVSAATAERLKSYVLRPGMIVMGRRGEMGRCAVVGEREKGWLCGTGSFFVTPTSEMLAGYLTLLFSTPYAKSYLVGESVGTTMNNLNHKILSAMPVSIPPLAEQKRIVTRLEPLLPLCERLKRE